MRWRSYVHAATAGLLLLAAMSVATPVGAQTFRVGSFSKTPGTAVTFQGTATANFQGATTVSGTVNFTTTGYHQIDVGFFQGGGGNGLLVAYTPPGGISTTIPNSILASAGSTFAGTQTYGNNFVVTSNTTIDVSNSLSAVIGPVSIGANTLALTGTTGASLVSGRIEAGSAATIVSGMAEHGVIFSDGIEADFLEFNAGARATIGIAERQGLLVV